MKALVLELAARHGLDPIDLGEAWTERAAIRQYEGGRTRGVAELGALHEIEVTYRIGHHCTDYRSWAMNGGDRRRPAESVGHVHALPIGPP